MTVASLRNELLQIGVRYPKTALELVGHFRAVIVRIIKLILVFDVGLQFDPSHFVWQMMDPIECAREFIDKIHGVHLKARRQTTRSAGSRL